MANKKVEIDFALLQCLIFNVGRSAQVASYEAWEDAFSRKWIVDGLEKSYEAMREQQYDFTSWTKEDLQAIGFMEWQNNIMLIPLYILPALPEGIELIDINDGKHILGTDRIDLDVRYNCIAYGIQLPTEGDEANDQTIYAH